MNKKRILGAITLASVLVFGLAACGGGNKAGAIKQRKQKTFQKCQSLLKMIKKQLMAGH